MWGATKNRRKALNRPQFQSTHPVWGATSGQILTLAIHENFNPRTPCGVRLVGLSFVLPNIVISIHAPRVGCDLRWFPIPDDDNISIHAPRVGCDDVPVALWVDHRISIHAPRVGCDHGRHSPIQLADEFQSTHPVWGATWYEPQPPGWWKNFNPRTPCGVRLCITTPPQIKPVDFNPRTPCGVRPAIIPWTRPAKNISIHAPRVGCDVQLERTERFAM